MQTIEVFSGGSEGAPKKVVRPRQTWLDSLALESQAFDLMPQDRYGILGSSQHSLWTYAMFRAEQTQSFCTGLVGSPRQQLNTILTGHLSVLYAVTPLLNLLCQQALVKDQSVVSVKKIIAGGASWPEGLTALCQRIFPNAELFCFYGSAELGYVSYGKPGEPLRPFPGVQIQRDDEQQLWVRSALTISPSQWLASGDRIAWAEPSAEACASNAFYLLGRIDRLINQAGIKIQPEPIEDRLKTALNCMQLAILGLPDSLRGERVGVILGPELQSRYADLRRVYEDLPHAIGATLKKARIIQLECWPLLANGKLSLEQLRTEVLQRALTTPTPFLL